MKPTAFTSASAIVISTNALWEKHLNNHEPQFHGAQSAAMPRLHGAQSAQSPNPKATGAFQH